MKNNPYPRSVGFFNRLSYAEKALKERARGRRGLMNCRTYDNCFEHDDANAVVWALVSKALDQDDVLLRQGINAAFSIAAPPSGWENGIYDCWYDVYAAGELNRKQLSLFTIEELEPYKNNYY